MKLIKLASLALAAAGTFGVCNAGAAVTTTTNFTPLNVAITLRTNIADRVSVNSKSTNTTYSVRTSKITNKQLLELFTRWSSKGSTNSWLVNNARLVIGWDEPWYGDVLVIRNDNSGTVLFDATAFESQTEGSAYFYVDFADYNGAYTGKNVNGFPGSYSYTEYFSGEYYLEDNNYILPYTYLYGYYGGSTVSYSESWDKNNNPTRWSLNGRITFPMIGDQYFNNSDTGSASATITTRGSGRNSYLSYWD
jgi:hypothetical protein